MSDTRNQLLLAALQRAGKPLASDDLLDAAVGLALAEGWTPEQTRELSRRSVAARLQNMLASNLVVQVGDALDETSRRLTPLFAPTGLYNPRASVPCAPTPGRADAGRESPYGSMDRTQLLVVLEAHDDMLECIGRFFADLTTVREKVRRRLHAAGMGQR